MMNDCHSECDCGWPGPDYGPHDPDCHQWQKCDEGRWCDKHHAEALAEHAYLRDIPRYAVFLNDPEAKAQFNQDLRDAGRGHLVRE